MENLPPNQRVWLTASRPLMLAENTAVVAVPNEFTRNQLEGRLRTRHRGHPQRPLADRSAWP